MQLVGGAATDTGRVRAANEDSVLIAEGVFAVADGMGGHRGGEVASTAALEAFNAAVGAGGTAQALVDGVNAANSAVYELSSTDARLAGMGTTLVALAAVAEGGAEHVAVINIGDSRVYLLSGDELVQISEDHSLVETMVRTGQLSAEEASVHPRRNVLTRALGIEPAVEVDGWMVQPRSGDRFLLCSDGLFNELDSDEITSVLRQLPDPSEAAFQLVRLANEAGGRDNISAVVIDVVDGPADAASAGQAVGERLVRFTETSDEQIIRGDDTQVFVSAPVPPNGGASPDTDPLDALDVLSAPGDTSPRPATSADGEPIGDAATQAATPASGSAPGDAQGAQPEPDEPERSESGQLDTTPPASSRRTGDAPSEPARAPRRSEAVAAEARPAPKDKRFTWRVWALLVAIVAVVVVAFVAIVVAGRSGYFLEPEDGELVLYEGRRGGLLFIDPQRVEPTGVALEDLDEAYRDRVADVTWTDRNDADEFVDELRAYAEQGRERQAAATSTTTTTSTPPSTTTVVPGP